MIHSSSELLCLGAQNDKLVYCKVVLFLEKIKQISYNFEMLGQSHTGCYS